MRGWPFRIRAARLACAELRQVGGRRKWFGREHGWRERRWGRHSALRRRCRRRRCAAGKGGRPLVQHKAGLGEQRAPLVDRLIAGDDEQIGVGGGQAVCQPARHAQLQRTARTFEEQLERRSLADRRSPGGLVADNDQRNLRPQKFWKIDNRLAASAARQKGDDEVQHAPVVMARHIGVGQNIKIAERQHAAGGAAARPAAECHRCEGVLAGAQAAQGAGCAAHLGNDRPFDAAPAVKTDPAARQFCRLVQIASLEKMGVVGVVVGDIVEVIFLEDDVKGQRQAVGVARGVALDVRVADQQQTPPICQKTFDDLDLLAVV